MNEEAPTVISNERAFLTGNEAPTLIEQEPTFISDEEATSPFGNEQAPALFMNEEAPTLVTGRGTATFVTNDEPLNHNSSEEDFQQWLISPLQETSDEMFVRTNTALPKDPEGGMIYQVNDDGTFVNIESPQERVRNFISDNDRVNEVQRGSFKTFSRKVISGHLEKENIV